MQLYTYRILQCRKQNCTVLDVCNKVCVLNLIMKHGNNFGPIIALGERFDLGIAQFNTLRSWIGK